jgi:hypothetical protein
VRFAASQRSAYVGDILPASFCHLAQDINSLPAATAWALARFFQRYYLAGTLPDPRRPQHLGIQHLKGQHWGIQGWKCQHWERPGGIEPFSGRAAANSAGSRFYGWVVIDAEQLSRTKFARKALTATRKISLRTRPFEPRSYVEIDEAAVHE